MSLILLKRINDVELTAFRLYETGTANINRKLFIIILSLKLVVGVINFVLVPIMGRGRYSIKRGENLLFIL